MTSYQNYVDHLDYIEDDVGLHAFNLNGKDGLPEGLQEKVTAFLEAEKDLKRELVKLNLHMRDSPFRDRWLK